jgi:hydroxyethylthiazole kinase-like uncharacterized protein yjeF
MADRTEAGGPGPMLALLTSAELPAIDRHMAETETSGFVLMERAGAAIAREVEEFAPNAGRIAVVAGPNNNGGDCMCAARIMAAAGRDVVVALFARRSQLTGDPAEAAARWQGPLAFATPETLAGTDLIVDGLYGGGLKHDISGPAATLVAAVNASGVPVLAVDFPSGISGVSGAVLGTAVKADRTITFYCLKPGHLLMPGREHCGPVTVDPIGIPASVMDTVRPKAFHNRPELWTSALQRTGSERSSRGRVFLAPDPMANADRVRRVAASANAVGAEIVAAQSDADTVVVSGAPDIGPDGAWSSALRSRGAVVVSVVAPFGASIATDVSFSALRMRGAPTQLIVEGQAFAGLFPHLDDGSMLERVRRAAAESGAVVVYLGLDRIVAAPDGRGAIADNAPAEPVGAGTGDAVAGEIGGLLAWGMTAFEAAAAGIWLLGDAIGRCGVAAGTDRLAEGIAEAWRGVGRAVER